ncbi:MAG: copper homeostasis protein CutC [Clostridiales bacterium]|nr:copper homeostasis protein CutC [Clostridiales bacterium]
MKRYLLEVCCGSVEDVLAAKSGGADRVELNSCLFHGGLTPSIGELVTAKKLADIPIMTMVRPRQGGFCYTKAEYMTALADAEKLLENGTDGLVFGFLKEDGSLDEARTKEMAKLAGSKTKVFHRAIDVADDWKKMLSQLIDIGIDRVLTSGLAPDVFYGVDVIKEMVEFAAGRIQILPGAGVNLQNVNRILDITGCDQIHVARFKSTLDPSTANNRDIFYGGALYPPEDRYDVIDGEYIGKIREKI